MDEYNSEFTGKQIDYAVSRALPGGDIDNGMELLAPLVSPAFTGTPTINGVAVAPLVSPAFTGTPTINGVAVATVQTILSTVFGSNTNILDNWYFGNPVNQRGKASTNADGYFLDRWKCFDLRNSATVSLDNNSIAISAKANGTITVPRIAQIFENPSTYGSKTITFSMKYKLSGKGSIWVEDIVESQNRWLYQELPASQDWKLFKFTFATRSDITKLQISISLGTITVNSESSVSHDTLTEDSTLEIEAVKMEIGDRQTLAHQDADGSWVLNEIPNYAEELAKCQRYFVRIYGRCPAKNTSAQVTNQNGGFIPFPVKMRTNPSGSFAEKEMSTLVIGIITVNGFEIGGADNFTRGFTADFTADL